MPPASEASDGIANDAAASGTSAPGSTQGPSGEPSAGGVPGASGTLVGRYVLASELGRGGLGVVYRARDPELARDVAIKLWRKPTGADLPGNRARMVREAQAIARLAHPNVVAIYDVGSHAGGVFLAMELIDGPTLKEWLASSGRSARAIVDRFVEAGEGLAAAHAEGLVHRDFKPSNALVGSDGRVRVVDFGLARPEGEGAPPGAPDSSRGDGESPLSGLTQTGAVLGTPVYMSPEQRRGEPVDARSDQYAFCVALAEALSGELPPVDARASELGLARWVAPVLARGLASDPEARYSSMRDLLDELGSRRRARRRRIVGGAAALAGLAVAAVAIGLPASREASCSQLETEVRDRWTEAARSGGEQALLGIGAQPAQWQAIERSVQRYTNALAQARGSICRAAASASQRERRSHCAAMRQLELDATLRELASPTPDFLPQATRLIDGLPAPLECISLAADDLPGAPVSGEELAIERELARIRVAMTAHRDGRELPATRAIVSRTEAVDNPNLHARALRLLAVQLRDTNDHEESLKASLQAILAAERGATAPVRAEAWAERARELAWEHQQPKEALRHARHAFAVAETLPPGTKAGLRALYSVAAAHISAGEYRRAVEIASTGLDDADDSADPDGLVYLYDVRGAALARLNRFSDAERDTRAALALADELRGPDDARRAAIMHNLASSLAGLDRLGEAETMQREIVELLVANYGPENHRTANGYHNLANTLRRQGKFDEALAAANKSLTLRTKVLGEDNAYTAFSHRIVAAALHALERNEEALQHIEQAIKTTAAALGPEHPRAARELSWRGEILLSLERFDEADASFAQAGELENKLEGASGLSGGLEGRARVAIAAGRFDRAVDFASEAMKLAEQTVEDGDRSWVGETRFALARALWGRERPGDREQALAYARQARDEIGPASADVGHPRRALDTWLTDRDTAP